jgi:4-amino-4-deoxy-L-arabinose transferase-like glycosyltransferase
MTKTFPHYFAWAGIWLVVVVAALTLRPILPLDETRYFAVAWEMWRSGDLLVPELNGAFYSHKPPLLFWLINAGWSFFGPVEVWGRIVGPAFGLGAVFLTHQLARLLWPCSRPAQLVGPWIVCGTLLWLVTTTLSMFDTMIMFFTLVSLIGLALAASARAEGGPLVRRRFVGGWILFALGIGLGVLSKGPVILVFTLPVALLAPVWWSPAGSRVRVGVWNWYLMLGAGFVVGAGVALAWAIPAAISGGEEFARAIFLGQTTGRIAGSFSHGRPFWWYLPMLLALLFPWILWPTLWRGLRAADWRCDPGVRFAVVWFVAAFFILSSFTDKQPHYFLAAIPAFALLAGRSLTTISTFEAPGWATALPLVPIAVTGVALVVLSLRPDIAIELAGDTPLTIGSETMIAGAAILIAIVISLGVVGRKIGRQVYVLAVVSAVGVVALHLSFGTSAATLYDIREPAQRLRAIGGAGRAVAHVGKYHGQFHYIGRLEVPLSVISGDEVTEWFVQNPDGVVVYLHRRQEDVVDGTAIYVQPFRGRWLAIWDRAGADIAPEIFER